MDVAFNPGSGANTNVYVAAIQSDGKVLIGGSFTNYNGTTRNYLARLNADGSLDTGFVPSTLNGNVYSLAIQSDGKIIAGGDFTSVGAQSYKRVARLGTNGTVDTTFDPGTGANASVNAVALQSDGKVIAAGAFTNFNGVSRHYIVRLTSTGSVDSAYNDVLNNTVYAVAIQSDGKQVIGGGNNLITGSSARSYYARLLTTGKNDTTFGSATLNGEVLAIGIQADGKVVVGGAFTSIDGSSAYSRIGRLTTAGALDTSFTPGTGANNTVYAVTLQPDGKIILGGFFTGYNGQTRNRVARVNTNGTLDTYFDAGTGANDVVWSTAINTLDGSLVIGGGFTQVNGTSRNRIAKLFAY